jgi:hypothetical protein
LGIHTCFAARTILVLGCRDGLMPRAGGWRAAAAGLLLLLLLLCLALRSPGEAPGPGPTAGLHWMGFTGREARLAERLREAEATDRWLRLQLAASQARAGRALARRPGPAPGCQPAAEPCEPVHVAIVCAGRRQTHLIS